MITELTRRAIVCTVGLPGSGKSTWADEQIRTDTSGLLSVVNRDHIRRMIRRPFGADEDAVTVVQYAAITALLHYGHTVIVDDTNLNPEHLDSLGQLARSISRTDGQPVDIVHVTSFLFIPRAECVRRDAQRPPGEQVGEDVITGLYRKWRLYWPGLEDTGVLPHFPQLTIKGA